VHEPVRTLVNTSIIFCFTKNNASESLAGGKIDYRKIDILWYICLRNTGRSFSMDEVSFLLCESDEACLEWWAHDLNDENLFQSIRRKARKNVFWRCPSCGSVFEKEVFSMAAPYGPNCPDCALKRKEALDAERKFFKNTPVSYVPELLSAWDDERDPTKCMIISVSPTHSHNDTVFRFKCSHGHHAWVSPYTYLKNGCPYCNSSAKTEPGNGYIADKWPELAAEWALNEGAKYTPYNTRHNSSRIIEWRCMACGHKWSESPKDRTRTYSASCPNCGKILGSLGWKYPEIAKEWSTNNELSIW